MESETQEIFMKTDVLDELAQLEQAQRDVIDAVIEGDVRVDVGADLLEDLGFDPERVRELLEPIDDNALVERLRNHGGA